MESYSIKKLEPLYGYARSVSLSDANRALVKVQALWSSTIWNSSTDADRAAVAGYNRDDCLSTRKLRDWLEECREYAHRGGRRCAPAEPKSGEASEKVTERQQQIDALAARLTEGVPADPVERTPEQHARWLLANSLDWHRREQKALWWERYRLRDLTADELFDERAGLSGLTFVGVTGGTTKAPIHRYSFPPQENEFRGGEVLFEVGGLPAWLRRGDRDRRAGGSTSRSARTQPIIHPEAVFGQEKILGRSGLGEFARTDRANSSPTTAWRVTAPISPPATSYSLAAAARWSAHPNGRRDARFSRLCALRARWRAASFRSRGRPAPGRLTQARV